MTASSRLNLTIRFSRAPKYRTTGDRYRLSSQDAGGFSSKSEYTRAQYEASAANKDEFFKRKQQENASRPDHLPPSQGGKYVGFGSGYQAPPKPAATGVEDVTAMLSKGLYSLSTAAAATVKSGTATISKTLQEKQVDGLRLALNFSIFTGDRPALFPSVIGCGAAERQRQGYPGGGGDGMDRPDEHLFDGGLQRGERGQGERIQHRPRGQVRTFGGWGLDDTSRSLVLLTTNHKSNCP